MAIRNLNRRELIRHRIKKGWSLDDACNRPHRAKGQTAQYSMSIAELARIHGISSHTLHYRLKSGMSQADAISEPSKRRRLTKKEILDAKSFGLTKDKTAEYILKCTRITLYKKLKEYGIEWRESNNAVKPVAINGVEYDTLKAALKAQAIPVSTFWYWRKKRTGTTQELLQQYIDFRASKKH